MLKSWRVGRILGFPIEINLSFLLLLGLVLVAFGGFGDPAAMAFALAYMTVAFASVVVHELGHATVARQLGVQVVGIELGFLGGAAKMINLPRTPRHELLIAAAGPAVSLALGGLFLGLGMAVGSRELAMVGWINFVIAAFNLIPALPMDGGRILRALLVPRLGYVRATDRAVAVARVAAVGFAIAGVLLPVFQLIVLAPILWLMGTQERRIARMSPGVPWGWGGGGRGAARADDEDVDEVGTWGDDDRRARGWDSPFDPRFTIGRRRGRGGPALRRFTVVRRGGRTEVVPLD